MATSVNAAKTAPIKDTSLNPSSGQLTPLEITKAGNLYLLAVLAELQKRGYPIEAENQQVDGNWVAFLRLPRQMWTDEGDLQESEPCKKSQMLPGL